MQRSDAGRLGVLVVTALAAWELGQVVATYVLTGLFKGHQLGFLPGNGFGQGDALALLITRVALAALVAIPVVLVLARLLWRDRE